MPVGSGGAGAPDQMPSHWRWLWWSVVTTTRSGPCPAAAVAGVDGVSATPNTRATDTASRRFTPIFGQLIRGTSMIDLVGERVIEGRTWIVRRSRWLPLWAGTRSRQ